MQLIYEVIDTGAIDTRSGFGVGLAELVELTQMS